MKKETMIIILVKRFGADIHFEADNDAGFVDTYGGKRIYFCVESLTEEEVNDMISIDEEEQGQPEAYRNKCIEFLKSEYPTNLAWVNKYVQEADKHEGPRYFMDTFDNMEELQEGFTNWLLIMNYLK